MMTRMILYLYIGGRLMVIVDETKIIHSCWDICLRRISRTHGRYIILLSILRIILILLFEIGAILISALGSLRGGVCSTRMSENLKP